MSTAQLALCFDSWDPALWFRLAPSPGMETGAGFQLALFPSVYQRHPSTDYAFILKGYFSGKCISWVGIAGNSFDPAHHAEFLFHRTNAFDNQVDVVVVGPAFYQ